MNNYSIISKGGNDIKKHIILIEFPWGREKDPRVPLGHASLLATLQANEKIIVHSIVREINHPTFSIEEVFEEIRTLTQHHRNIDIGIGVYVWAEVAIQKLLPMLKTLDTEVRIILGGPQISYSSKGLEEIYPDADVFVRGYGEFALLDLTLNKEIQNPLGIHLAGQEDMLAQTSVNIELLPSPWLNNIINTSTQKFVRWETQRGCPFTCTFCQHKEPGSRLKKKEFDFARVMSEIDLFCSNEVNDIAVLDPIFNASSHSTNVLERFISNKYKGKLSLQCRAEMITDEFIDLASQLNVKLEFGLQTIHVIEGKAVKRKNNIPKVNNVLNKIRTRGIDYEISIIFGLPEQTLASFSETVEWCLLKKVPTLKAFPLMLLRGTEVERNKENWGLLESSGEMPIVTSSNTFSTDDWRQMAQIAEALFQTQGNHPQTMAELIETSKVMKFDTSRYCSGLSLDTRKNIVRENIYFKW